MSAPSLSKVVVVRDGERVVVETDDADEAGRLVRAELDRRGIPRERVEERET